MNHLLTTLFLIFNIYAFGQTHLSRIAQQPEIPSNIERYESDYKLKDYTFVNGDSSILESINLEYLEQFRSTEHNIEVIDPNTGLSVILFSERKRKTGITLQQNH